MSESYKLMSLGQDNENILKVFIFSAVNDCELGSVCLVVTRAGRDTA
jgi:hypothetical protein